MHAATHAIERVSSQTIEVPACTTRLSTTCGQRVHIATRALDRRDDDAPPRTSTAGRGDADAIPEHQRGRGFPGIDAGGDAGGRRARLIASATTTPV